ncbi:hypothetical protein GEW_13421, partial [Pasteurella multocida subsp. gallicida str. Anand1_poultry]
MTTTENKITGAFKMVGNGHAAGNSGGGTLVEFNASLVVPTADENRPKSIILKLCIKAKIPLMMLCSGLKRSVRSLIPDIRRGYFSTRLANKRKVKLNNSKHYS